MASTPTQSSPASEVRVRFEGRGAIAQMWGMRDPEIIISGPFGTGKTVGILQRFHIALQKYDHAKMLVIRKRHTDLTATTLATFQSRVLNEYDGVKYFGGSGKDPAAFRYDNGSELVVAGMDRDTKALGAEYDWIFPSEAIEFSEHEWEMLNGRCRWGRLDYAQVIGDCNPGPQTHWILKRAERKQLALLYSHHQDNPWLWDGQQWTEAGQRYMSRLEGFTGVRRARYLEGRWVSAEGAVYEFNHSVHLIDRFEIPADWPRFRVVDFGYTNPFVCQWWAVDHDGRMFMYREIYMSQRIVSDHAKDIIRLSTSERIGYTVADHDAEDRATLKREGIDTVAAKKAVTVGIQATEDRLRVAGDGKPRLFILRDSLVEKDARMEEMGKPWCTEQEFDSYVWSKGADGKPVKEEPVKVDDHGMDSTRYGVMSREQPRMTGQRTAVSGPRTAVASYTPR